MCGVACDSLGTIYVLLVTLGSRTLRHVVVSSHLIPATSQSREETYRCVCPDTLSVAVLVVNSLFPIIVDADRVVVHPELELSVQRVYV